MEDRAFSTPFILQRGCGSDVLFGHGADSANFNNDKSFSSLQLYEIQVIPCLCLLLRNEPVPLSES
jgi:hypothetical protein